MSNILYISFVDWFWIKQRPHHFAESLSKNNKIVYFCMQPWRKNSNKVITNEENKNEVNLSNIKKGNLIISRKKVIPFHRKFKIIEKINDKILNIRLRRLNNINEFDIIIFTHPMQMKYFPLNILKEQKIVYDCMDDYEEFNYYNSEELLKYEKELYRISEKIVCTSDRLKDKLIKKYGDKNNIKVINNGVDLENFNIDKSVNSNLIDINIPNKIAYIGAISEWFDFELIKNVALKNKDINFYIFGPIEDGININHVRNIDNIKFMGSISYKEVPNVLSSIDVAIMPFKLNELIKAVNPVKIYEYLAMGKNVLAIRYTETEKFEEYIDLYSNENEFESKIRKLLLEKSEINYKLDYAKENSWEKRVEDFFRFINN